MLQWEALISPEEEDLHPGYWAGECGWDWGCHWHGSFLGMLLTGLIFPPDGEERLLFQRGFVG